MMRKIKNVSLMQKILTIMLIGLSIMGAVSYIIIQILSSEYNKMLYQTMSESLSHSAKEIVEYMESMENLTEMFLADGQIQEGMQELKESDEKGEKPYKALADLRFQIGEYYYNYNDEILNYISVHTPLSMLRTNLIAADKVPEKIQKELLKEAGKKEGAVCWIDDYMNEYGLFLARDIRRLEGLQLDTLGTIMLNIDMDKLISSSTKFEEQYGKTEYIILSGDKLLYHTEPLSEENINITDLKNIDQYGIQDMGERYFVAHGKIARYDWEYYCLVSYEKMGQQIARIRGICLWIIGFVFVFALCLTVPLLRSLLVHISGLKKRMQQFALDNTRVPETKYNYADRGDELGVLNRQFDEMSETIIDLIQKNYINEILKKEAQIKALENQINPHFLYNTLDSIKWRAKAIGEKDISDMVEALGVLLRTTLRNKDEEDYTIGKEMKVIDSYITIQKLRYEERLCFENSIDERWYSYRIPKLVLQPLVENAIFYGLEMNVDECQIILSIEKKEEALYFYVKNTGSEMESELLEKLEKKEITPHGHGVGLMNIDSRVRMQYGEEYGLRLYNEGEYAIAELKIPAEEISGCGN